MVPLGIVALVAGCGGGSMVSTPSGSTYVPPGPSSPGVGTAGTAKATLTLYVPPRRPSAAGRHPSYISAGTSTVSVSVFPAGMASPWPNPTVTSVPTMGPTPAPPATPSPIPVTMTLNAPLGPAQFFVNTYDANGTLLSGALSSPAPISATAPNTVTLTLNASAQCLQINHAGSNVSVFPLENQNHTQMSTFTVSPCDADGYAIPAGQQLANALVFTKTNPSPPLSSGRRPASAPLNVGPSRLSFSPAQITQGGDTTVTVTYASGAKLGETQYLVPTLSSSPPPQWATILATPVEEIFVTNGLDNTVSVYNAVNSQGSLSLTSIGTVPVGSSPSHIVGNSSLAGCAQAGQLATTNDGGGISVFSIPLPTNMATPSPALGTATLISGLTGPASAEYINGCDVYIGAGGYLSKLTGMTSYAPVGGPYSGGAPITGIAIKGDTFLGMGYLAGANTIFDATTAAATTVAPNTDAMTVIGGTGIYAGDVAVAYHSGGYLHFGIFDGTTPSMMADVQTAGNTTIKAMVSDNGAFPNIYAIGSGSNTLWQYLPNTPSATSGTLTGSLYPSAIALDSTNHIFIADNNGGSGKGTLYEYSYFLDPGPSTFSVGVNPTGVTIVP
ncbi:MAG: hypothetical protein M3M96_05630 [Candidatus Eremiobacteraeota bacterium]|nr:hypothetical protein [Candidatus Eremiobacteraeota bacterium]